jgi:hypothetical protein
VQDAARIEQQSLRAIALVGWSSASEAPRPDSCRHWADRDEKSGGHQNDRMVDPGSRSSAETPPWNPMRPLATLFAFTVKSACESQSKQIGERPDLSELSLECFGRRPAGKQLLHPSSRFARRSTSAAWSAYLETCLRISRLACAFPGLHRSNVFVETARYSLRQRSRCWPEALLHRFSCLQNPSVCSPPVRQEDCSGVVCSGARTCVRAGLRDKLRPGVNDFNSDNGACQAC